MKKELGSYYVKNYSNKIDKYWKDLKTMRT